MNIASVTKNTLQILGQFQSNDPAAPSPAASKVKSDPASSSSIEPMGKFESNDPPAQVTPFGKFESNDPPSQGLVPFGKFVSNDPPAPLTPIGRFVSNDPPSKVDGPRAPLHQLGDALASGDLAASKEAFGKLQSAYRSHMVTNGRSAKAKDSDGDNDGTKAAASTNTRSAGKAMVTSDFKSLADALASNDLASAQKAWAQFMADVKARTSAPASAATSIRGINIEA